MGITKQAVREAMLMQLRQLYTGIVREEQSLYLRQQLATQLAQHKARLNIAIYAPLAHEVNLMPLLKEEAEHHYYFPRCGRHGQMEFHHIQSPQEELIRSKMGFLQALESTPQIKAQDIDLIIVPGIAFTKEGQRLGYGGGYYDRYLPRCPHAHKIALCFKRQMIESIPQEKHDLSIAQIISSPA